MKKSQLIGVVFGLVLSTIGLAKDNQSLTILGAGLFSVSATVNHQNKDNKSGKKDTRETSAKQPEIVIPVIAEKPALQPKPIPQVKLSAPSQAIVTKAKATGKPKPILKKDQTN